MSLYSRQSPSRHQRILAIALCLMSELSVNFVNAAADDLERFRALGGAIVPDTNRPGASARAWLGPKFAGDYGEGVSLLSESTKVILFDQSKVGEKDLAHVDFNKFRELQRLSFNFCDVSGRFLLRIDRADSLRSISMMATKIGDEELGAMNKFAKLQSLYLNGCKITDKGLRLLRLNSLRAISLDQTEISEKVPEALDGCPHIQIISLNGTASSNRTCQMLAGYKELASISLRRTSVTDEGLQFLASLKDLQFLSLDFNQLSDRGLRHLRACKKLNTLTIAHTEIADEGIKELVELPLEELDLSSTKVTVRTLETVTGMKNLKMLKMNNCAGIDESSLNRLRAMRPGLRIEGAPGEERGEERGHN